jgi:hypothetical protein
MGGSGGWAVMKKLAPRATAWVLVHTSGLAKCFFIEWLLFMDLPVGKGSIGKVGFRCCPVGKGAKRINLRPHHKLCDSWWWWRIIVTPVTVGELS